MTTSTEMPTTAVEMSKLIIEHMGKAVLEGGTAAEARASLAKMLRDQEHSTSSSSDAEETPASRGILRTEEEFVIRPNGEKYYTRKFGEHSDLAAIKEARKKHMPVLMYGEPGTGKTALIEAALHTEGPFYTVQGSGDTETGDFIGGYVQLPNGQFEWIDGPLVRAMEEGGTLYIDEIALIDPKVLSIVYGAMDGRDELAITQNPERGTVKSKEGFYVIAACNPNAPGARMSEALTSRFLVHVEVTTDYNLARKLGVPKKVITAADNLNKKRLTAGYGWAPAMRELLAFRDVRKTFGEEVALSNLVAVAPEVHREQVRDVIARAYAKKVDPLQVS